ncbi:PQQ-binding-like beta-propeller repeat protein [Marinifilum sp. N1E240]|uniref:outer membrane protein assembly factor BamB family protein n=1 Tax=Marinifilum sp. N1E240 TaxID=2608082 RepID=UPI00128B20FC|nr:PQQ-binding-like beta-propeller repeat protein [Marinifilum sp. N1E240]MPQ48374.1 PQQ-binding-like beta-propeller repeat protein [Marinifilum sp. N1E240]
MKNYILLLVAVSLFSCTPKQKKVSEWRGDNRSGIYNETNLLKEWPKDGPNLLWDAEGIGNGYGSPVISGNTLYVNGEIDSIAYLIAMDLQGKVQWKTEFGHDWMKNFIGSRSAPTVVDDMVYVASGLGDVACIHAVTGELKWKINMLEKFEGKNTRFGYSQSLLVDGDLVYAAPGGTEDNIIALDRFTGETKWTNAGVGEVPAYCSPLLIEFPTRNVLITFSEHALIGIESQTGEVLWTEMQDTLCDINGNTPIFDNGYLYYVTGCGNGTVKMKIAEDGGSITEVWRNKELDNIMGGAVKLNGKIIASGHRKKVWKSVDAETGETRDTLKFGRGATIAADGMLYCYNERGQVGLVKVTPENMELVSKFKVTKGTKEHFAQPIINNGVLYVRHGDALLAYDIKKKS